LYGANQEKMAYIMAHKEASYCDSDIGQYFGHLSGISDIMEHWFDTGQQVVFYPEGL